MTRSVNGCARERRTANGDRRTIVALTNPKDMFEAAYDNQCAVGAFGVYNMESVQAILTAANEEAAPVIAQIGYGTIKNYSSPDHIQAVVAAVAADVDIPVCLHLDHSADFETVKYCIDAGFNSVMIDGSHLGYDANVAITRQVVEYAKQHGVWVEAEIGRLPGFEDMVFSSETVLTEPDVAAKFVEATNCDSLAVAVGTSHGGLRVPDHLQIDFDLLSRIMELLPSYPLVLHGGANLPDELVDEICKYGGRLEHLRNSSVEHVQKASTMGICKVNNDVDHWYPFLASLRRTLVETPDVYDPRKILGASREATKQKVRWIIREVFGSSGLANKIA
jgi:fructose-bisphosphate aldolase class II